MPNPLALGLLVLFASLSPAAPVTADEERDRDYTTLALGESAAREVEQDTLVAVLTARHVAPAALEAQRVVNQAMAAAIEQARALAGVQVSTGGYRVYQEYDRQGRPRAWIAEQDLRLEGRDSAQLLGLAGHLQGAGLLLGGLSYQLSAEARRALEDELTLEAIGRLRARAERIADAMTMRIERIETLRVGSVAEQPPIRPMFDARMATEAAAMPPPVALPGTERVEVGIDAEVALVPE